MTANPQIRRYLIIGILAATLLTPAIAAADVKAVLAKRPGLLRTFETALGQYDTPEVGLMGPLYAAVESLPALDSASQ